MNVQPITMDRKQAREAFLAYKRSVRARHDQETDAIMRGYRQLSLGRQVVELRSAILGGGLDAQHRPRIAFARADARWCFYQRAQREAGGHFVWKHDPDGRIASWWRSSRHHTRIVAPEDTLPVVERWQRAQVPLVPPQYMPKRGALGNFHLLWEAVWQPAPPVDPMLLRSLGGGLYVVVAQWDLTPLERAVLGQRFAAG